MPFYFSFPIAPTIFLNQSKTAKILTGEPEPPSSLNGNRKRLNPLGGRICKFATFSIRKVFREPKYECTGNVSVYPTSKETKGKQQPIKFI